MLYKQFGRKKKKFRGSTETPIAPPLAKAEEDDDEDDDDEDVSKYKLDDDDDDDDEEEVSLNEHYFQCVLYVAIVLFGA